MGTNFPVIPATPTPTGMSLTDLLANRDFQSLLAGVGARLDPKGPGGALGLATQQYLGMLGAREQAQKQADAQNAQTKLVIDALAKHGGFTPRDTPGVTSAQATPDGGVKLDITPPVAPAGATGGVAPVAPVAPTAPVTPTGAVAPTGAVDSQRAIGALLPFYLAPLR